MRLTLPQTRDPDAEALVAQILALGQPSLRERGVAGARSYLEDRSAAGPPGPAVDIVEDHSLDVDGRALPVRTYRSATATPSPVVVYFHGGGWVIGSVAASDAFCRRLVHAAGCVVISVDYPLAPEFPFPAAIDSAVVAINWAADRAGSCGGDPDRLIVLGDSAGGNIATVAVGRLARDGISSVRRQILAYPGTTAEREASGSPFGRQWPLTDDDRVWFLDQYVVDSAQRANPEVAPLLSDSGGLPPTTLLLGGCDPMLAEGMAYADRLWTAGVSVDLHVFAGQIHGFLTMDATILPRSREALGVVANAVRNA